MKTSSARLYTIALAACLAIPQGMLHASPHRSSSVSVSFGTGVGPCRTGVYSGYSSFGYPSRCYSPPVYHSYPCTPYYSGSVRTVYYGSYPSYPATVISTPPPAPVYVPPRYVSPSYQTYPPYSSVGGPVYESYRVPAARPVEARTQTSAARQPARPQEQTIQVQAALRKLGYYTGSIDGLMGPATQTAIRTFQIDHGLSVTGKIDDKLERELEKESSGDPQR